MTLLTGRNIPVAGECEIKNVLAMKIMDAFNTGGSFSEFYGMDFNDDLILMRHDGPAHFKIADGKVGIFILTIFSFALCQAQKGSINKLPDHNFNLKVSYNSSLIYPGVSTGIEFPVRQGKEQGLKKHPHDKSVIKDRFIAANLSWYHHRDFHDNLYLTAEWVMRRTGTEGFISEFSSGIGYSRTFLAGTTYKVSDNGDVSVIKLAGYSYALITIGGGWGYDFSVKKQLPFSTFAKMNMLLMFPYNSTIYLRPVMELGIRYTPGQIIIKKIKKESISISQ